MIGSINGKIQAVIKSSVIVDVNGVGYRALVPALYFNDLKIGEQILLYTHLQVREDAHILFGFKTLKELEFFQLLLTVSDVGPKSALGILSIGSIDDIERAIAKQDLTFLTAVAGIGKKTAERIMIGLKDKLAEKSLPYSPEQNVDAGEIFDALKQMGYTPPEIREVLKKMQGDSGTTEMKLKKALRMLGK